MAIPRNSLKVKVFCWNRTMIYIAVARQGLCHKEKRCFVLEAKMLLSLQLPHQQLVMAAEVCSDGKFRRTNLIVREGGCSGPGTLHVQGRRKKQLPYQVYVQQPQD